MAGLGRSSRRVDAALRELGLDAAADTIVTLSESTRTAAEAAAALGVEQGAIVKSLVFRAVSPGGASAGAGAGANAGEGAGEGAGDGDAVVALVSGDRRADESRVAEAAGVAGVGRADADFVRASTGFAIGGVAPVGHPAPLRTVMDAGLLRFPVVWAAAGSPHAVFGVEPGELARAIGVEPVELA